MIARTRERIEYVEYFDILQTLQSESEELWCGTSTPTRIGGEENWRGAGGDLEFKGRAHFGGLVAKEEGSTARRNVLCTTDSLV